MNRRHFLVTLLAAAPLSTRGWASALHADETSFLVIGDWGTGGQLQRRIATSMARVAKSSGASFVISTGDNIYPDGVVSTTDPQWKTKYENVYKELDLPWWAVLGNHDHRGEPDAQIEYAKTNPRWNMPGRTWSKDIPGGMSGGVSILGIDTTPMVQGASGWKDQLTWLDRTLGERAGRTLVVVGHHPLRSYGHYGDTSVLVKHLKPLLDAHRVRMYMCGHEHDMQLIRNPSDQFSCLVSGGGGGERPAKSGDHSRIAYTGGGFALIRLANAELSVEMFDSYGVTRGRFVL